MRQQKFVQIAMQLYSVKHCAVNLVYHKRIDRLICHHCSSFYEPQQICKMCSSDKFISLGIGLERLARGSGCDYFLVTKAKFFQVTP